MGVSRYNTVKNECTAEYVEKKSRFIATMRAVASENEALDFIAFMKKKYWDARHNCSAYIIAGNADPETGKVSSDIEKCSDDGEPSKTAGAPMLDVLRGAGLKNVVMVVTRYFGGILLGTGGLVRAYSKTAADCTALADTVIMRLLNKVCIQTDYNSYGKLTYMAAEEDAVIAGTEFTDNVVCTLLCDDIALGKITNRMAEATSGKCVIDILEKDYYPVEK